MWRAAKPQKLMHLLTFALSPTFMIAYHWIQYNTTMLPRVYVFKKVKYRLLTMFRKRDKVFVNICDGILGYLNI